MENKGVIVRNAGGGDVLEVARLHVWKYAAGMPARGDNFKGRVRFYRDKIRMLMRREPGGFYVAEDGGNTAGFIMISRDAGGGMRRFVFDLAAWRIALGFLFFQYGLNVWFLKFAFGNAVSAAFSVFKSNRSARDNSCENKPTKNLIITNIVVHAKYRGRGISKMLIKCAEEYAAASGADAISATAHVENIAAIRMYESAGFERRGKCSDSYGESILLIKQIR